MTQLRSLVAVSVSPAGEMSLRGNPPPPKQTPQKPPHATTWDRLSFRPRRGPAERGLCVSGHRPLVSEEESRPSPARPQGCPGMLQKRQRYAQKGAQGGIAAGELR